MQLDRRVRILELRVAIEHLESNRFPSTEESQLLNQKREELETINPTSPPFPAGGDVDLRCTRAEIEEDLAKAIKKAQPRLDQIARETNPLRKEMLEHDEKVAWLRSVENRLARWDQLAKWMEFKSAQEAKRGQ
jgi:hypothetical protein